MGLDYKQAGVDIEKGDNASRIAYKHAKSTFSTRKGKIGEPVVQDGSFAGMVNMGDFYLAQCCDTVGTKITLAEATGNYAGLGYDLVAMVADDAICSGAEVISLTNTFETQKVNIDAIDAMMASLAEACREQHIVIPGGEVAEVGDMTNGTGWGADAVGIVKPEKVITGEGIKPGYKIIGLKGRALRCNGFSLARAICKQAFGDNWYNKPWKHGQTWSEALLTPSKLFHRLLLDSVLGDFNTPRPYPVEAVVHITGGGVPGNVIRVLPQGMGAKFNNLHEPHEVVRDLQNLGNIEEAECYRTWHCGTAMMLVVEPEIADKICATIHSHDDSVSARIVGEITSREGIEIQSKFSGKILTF